MMPVEAIRTDSGAALRRAAMSAVSVSTVRNPWSPVQALALVALMRIALTGPPMRARHSFTGAALTLLVVNTPAALHGFSEAIRQ